MNKKIIFFLIIIVLVASVLLGFKIRDLQLDQMNNKEANENSETIKDDNFYRAGYASNLVKEDDLNKLKEILKNCNLSNVDKFISIVNEFNNKEREYELIKNWKEIKDIDYNDLIFAGSDDEYDSNCRISTYFLIMDNIDVNREVSFNLSDNSYLMFDIDTIENNSDYKIIQENLHNFIILFGQIDISQTKREDLKEIYVRKWEEYSIKNTNEDVSIITVINHSNFDNSLFVGHTGLLIKNNMNEENKEDQLIFLEKIGFGMPYQISVLNSKENLKEMFEKRANFFGEEDEEGPFVYENGNLLFELENKKN